MCLFSGPEGQGPTAPGPTQGGPFSSSQSATSASATFHHGEHPVYQPRGLSPLVACAVGRPVFDYASVLCRYQWSFVNMFASCVPGLIQVAHISAYPLSVD